MFPGRARSNIVVPLFALTLLVCLGSVSNASEIETVIAGVQANDSRLKSFSGVFAAEVQRSPEMIEQLKEDPHIEWVDEPLSVQTEIFTVSASLPKLRIEYEVREGDSLEGAVCMHKTLSIWDGEREYRFTPAILPPGVTISSQSQIQAQIIPLFMSVFALTQPRANAFSSENVSWAGYGEANGVSAIAVDIASKDESRKGYLERQWLDAERGFLPVKIERYEDLDGESILRSQTVFEDFEAYGDLWLPLTATEEELSAKGKVFETVKMNTIQLTVNDEVSADLFVPKIVPGMLVYDEDLQMAYRTE